MFESEGAILIALIKNILDEQLDEFIRLLNPGLRMRG